MALFRLVECCPVVFLIDAKCGLLQRHRLGSSTFWAQSKAIFMCMLCVKAVGFDWDSSLYECGVSLALFRLVECCPVLFLIDAKFGLLERYRLSSSAFRAQSKAIFMCVLCVKAMGFDWGSSLQIWSQFGSFSSC